MREYGIHKDIVYYIILVVTRLMIFITLYLLDKKQIFKQLIISNKYLTNIDFNIIGKLLNNKLLLQMVFI